MRPLSFLFLAMAAQPAVSKTLKGGPVNRALQSDLPEADVSKIIGGTLAQPGDFPYYVDIRGMCDQAVDVI